MQMLSPKNVDLYARLGILTPEENRMRLYTNIIFSFAFFKFVYAWLF